LAHMRIDVGKLIWRVAFVDRANCSAVRTLRGDPHHVRREPLQGKEIHLGGMPSCRITISRVPQNALRPSGFARASEVIVRVRKVDRLTT
jgi:hypothetical protein